MEQGSGKDRPNRLSNSTLEFHQTTYQKPWAIEVSAMYSGNFEYFIDIL